MTNFIDSSPTAKRAMRRERGFSLIEVLMAVVVLTLVGGAAARSVVLAASGRDRAEYLAAATEGARGMADRIEATSIKKLVARFGPGGTEGPTFDVSGLPGQAQGKIILVTDETAKDADIGMALGMPRDLDGDGNATSLDVSLSARVLPVIVEVSWTRPGSRTEILRLPVVVSRD